MKSGDLYKRVPYSIIIKILAERMNLGQTTTINDLLKIGISLPINKKNNFDRKIEITRLSRVITRMVKDEIIVRSGSYLSLKNPERFGLAWEAGIRICQAELFHKVETDAYVTFPDVWGDHLTEPVIKDVTDWMKVLNILWMRLVLNEIEQRVHMEIIDVDAKLMSQSEKALGLWMFNRALEGHLLQLGWVIEDGEGENVKPLMNKSFLERMGILSRVQCIYSNEGVDMIKNRIHKIALTRLITEIKRRGGDKTCGPSNRKVRLKEIDSERKMEIAQKVEIILRPLQKMSEPLIIARMTLPMYKP